MDSLQNINSTATVYVRAHCIRKPNSRTFKEFLTKIQDLQWLCLFWHENLEKNSRTFKDRFNGHFPGEPEL